MATISDITQGASYRGDAALGSFIPTAIQIDTKPLATLAAYTVMQNQAFYRQRQIDADAKIKELADLSQYDITNARGKDKELAITMFVDLQKKMKEYAQKGVPTNPQEKVKQELELKTSVKEATDKIKSLNQRGLSYNVRLNAINNENSTAEIKSVKKKQLDEEFDAGSWDTPIAAEEKFTANLPKIGAPVYTTNTTSVNVGDQVVQQTVQFFNPAKNLDNATADVLGFQNNTLPANATPEQVRQFELGQASGGQAKVLTDAATFLNSALADPKYRNEDGTINQQAVSSDNRIAASVLNGIDRYNKYAEDLKQDIRKGFYTTKLGKKIDLLNIVKETDVFTIDKNKPLSAEQIVFIQKFLDAAPDTKEEKIIETDDRLQQQGLGVDWYNAKTSRINATTPSASASSGSGGDAGGSDQVALLFGEHVNRLKNNFANGAKVVNVSYEKTDEITRKALGLQEGEWVTYLPNGTAMVGSKGGNGGRPLTVEQLRANFVVAVKGGSKEEAQLDAKFIEEQEAGLNSRFGTTSGVTIWNNWGTPQTNTPTTGAATTTPSNSGAITGFDKAGNPIYKAGNNTSSTPATAPKKTKSTTKNSQYRKGETRFNPNDIYSQQAWDGNKWITTSEYAKKFK